MTPVRVVIQVPEAEFERWEAHRPPDEPIGHWVRRAIGFLTTAEIEGTTSVTLGSRRKLIREIGACVRCGGRLRTRDPRARYCSDACRIAAWRERRAARHASGPDVT